MPLLDFNLLWISRCIYPAKHVVKTNQHDYYQMVFVLGGEGVISISDEKYNTSINQLYIFKPNVRHRMVASEYKPLSTVELKFYCNNAITENLIDQLPSFIKDTGNYIRTAFVNIIEEIKTQDVFTEHLIKALLTQIILNLVRLSNKNKVPYSDNHPDRISFTESNSKNSNEPLDKVVDYIRRNYFLEIKLNYLAEMVHLSPVYFCSIFKEKYGITPIQYLKSVRHENAKNLLITTNDSITAIAEKVGFQSVHYFSRVFKLIEGITPNEYRKRFKDYIIKDFKGDMTDFS
ncbi:MAG TPA: AraC family transcriptional regulator [Clostridiaceae bacterium]|nr:AraC family transcriptional regulator [Clostridiaceae bacterium]